MSSKRSPAGRSKIAPPEAARLIDDLELAAQILNKTGATRSLQQARLPFRGAIGRHHTADVFRLDHWRIRGSLMNTAVSDGSFCAIGVNLGPELRLEINGLATTLPTNGIVLLLPYDDVVQELNDTSSLVVRIPIDLPETIAISLLTPDQLARIPRVPQDSSARDFARWLAFVGDEVFDPSSPTDQQDQVHALSLGLVQRLHAFVSRYLPHARLSLAEDASRTIQRCFRLASVRTDAEITCKDLAEAALCSVRTLYRHFASSTTLTPLDYANLIQYGHRRCKIILAHLSPYADKTRDALPKWQSNRFFAETPLAAALRLGRSLALMRDT